MIDDPAQSFNDQWMIYDYWQLADNPDIQLDAKYDVGNVRIRDKMLQLQQIAYTDKDDKKGHHVSMAGLQTKRQDIMHGTFRTTFKVEGANGGSCAAWFWHRDDTSELDIEAITKGDSLVNNTINYTTHPSRTDDGLPIFNATLSVPLSDKYNTDIEVFHEHRFDSDRAGGAQYFIDGHLMQKDDRLVRKLGGNLQLKLWADGNKWWSGHPSSTTVTMYVSSVIAYFNTTGVMDGTDQAWFNVCDEAGGPSNDTVCEAYARVDKDDDLPLASSMQTLTATMAAASELPAESPSCLTNIDGTCESTSQAARYVPFSWLHGPKYLGKKIQNLLSRDEPTYTLPFGSPVEDDDDEDHANIPESQGAKVRPPRWFSTLYARNSTRVAYKLRQNPIVRSLNAVIPDSEQATDDKVKRCEQDKNDHCSFGQALDVGKWWTCIRKRSDWCSFFSGPSFLLTNGLIQVFSVPVIFAWVFYMTEG